MSCGMGWLCDRWAGIVRCIKIIINLFLLDLDLVFFIPSQEHYSVMISEKNKMGVLKISFRVGCHSVWHTTLIYFRSFRKRTRMKDTANKRWQTKRNISNCAPQSCFSFWYSETVRLTPVKVTTQCIVLDDIWPLIGALSSCQQYQPERYHEANRSTAVHI